jgi:hypothetical protein
MKRSLEIAVLLKKQSKASVSAIKPRTTFGGFVSRHMAVPV